MADLYQGKIAGVGWEAREGCWAESCERRPCLHFAENRKNFLLQAQIFLGRITQKILYFFPEAIDNVICGFEA